VKWRVCGYQLESRNVSQLTSGCVSGGYSALSAIG